MEGVFIELSNLFHIDYSFLLWIQTCLCSSTSISSGDSLDNFAQLFDLKEQHEIRSECRALADSLASEPNERLFLLSDLECIITHYIKSHLLPADPAAAFDAANGWPPVLRVLMRVAATDRRIAYRLFTAILHSYIPRCCFFRLIRIVHNAQCRLCTQELLRQSASVRSLSSASTLSRSRALCFHGHTQIYTGYLSSTSRASALEQE